MARVRQNDAHAGVEEGELTQPMLERAVVELDHGEGLGRRHESDFRAAASLERAGRVLRRVAAGRLQRRIGVAVGEAHLVDPAVAADLQFQPHRKRIDHGHADAVQAAGNLVGILVELTAGMELGHDDLGRRDAFRRVKIGRNSTPVVGDGAGAVGIERHRYEVGVAGQRLVDGVVDHLVDHVVQAGAVVGVADIHARTLAHRIQALENLDGIGAVLGGRTGKVLGLIAHEVLSRDDAEMARGNSPNRVPENG